MVNLCDVIFGSCRCHKLFNCIIVLTDPTTVYICECDMREELFFPFTDQC